MAEVTTSRIADILGDEASYLLDHKSTTISKDHLHLPGPDFVDRVWIDSDRNPQVLRSIQSIYQSCGRLGGTGYVSILPVDQGIEHSAGASFAKNPLYFDPENIVKARASKAVAMPLPLPMAFLGSVARKYAHKIPFILKINHNELLTYPEYVRTDHVRSRIDEGLEHGMRSGRRNDLFRI